MHQYLNAIGFGSMKSKKELYEILDKVEQQYTCHELVYQDEELDFCEYQKEFRTWNGDMSVRRHGFCG